MGFYKIAFASGTTSNYDRWRVRLPDGRIVTRSKYIGRGKRERCPTCSQLLPEGSASLLERRGFEPSLFVVPERL